MTFEDSRNEQERGASRPPAIFYSPNAFGMPVLDVVDQPANFATLVAGAQGLPAEQKRFLRIQLMSFARQLEAAARDNRQRADICNLLASAFGGALMVAGIIDLSSHPFSNFSVIPIVAGAAICFAGFGIGWLVHKRRNFQQRAADFCKYFVQEMER